jgi:hypothetical protein
MRKTLASVEIAKTEKTAFQAEPFRKIKRTSRVA